MNNKDEITPEGFLKLCLMEAKEDVEELWITLKAMGYNNGLQLTKVYLSLPHFDSSSLVASTFQSIHNATYFIVLALWLILDSGYLWLLIILHWQTGFTKMNLCYAYIRQNQGNAVRHCKEVSNGIYKLEVKYNETPIHATTSSMYLGVQIDSK